MEYLPRVIDDRLSRWLRGQPAVRLEGPRGCGKTTTALQHAGSAVHLDAHAGMTELAQLDPDRILTGRAPRLIDEWRLAPSLWPQLTQRLDDQALPGRYLLTSSATPLEYRHHTREAARLSVLRMRTMTLSERLGAQAPVSLAGLAYGDRVTGVRSRLSYTQLAEQAVRGGWPELLDADTDAAISYNAGYLQSLAHTDLKTLVLTRHQPDRITDLLTALARHTAADISLAGLGHDTQAGLARDTVRSYLDALDRLHVWEPQPAWQPPLNTRARLRHRPRAHLADPALACAALGHDADRLADDPDQFATIFTAMVIHDLRVYLEGTGAQLWHYKDETGLAIDAIIQYPDGRWAALQTSLGDHHTIDAEIALETLRDERLDLDQIGQPRYLAVITGGTHATTIRNRTHAIPLATLTA
ncbi:ATP-binding protein [Propioniciclava flava]